MWVISTLLVEIRDYHHDSESKQETRECQNIHIQKCLLNLEQQLAFFLLKLNNNNDTKIQVNGFIDHNMHGHQFGHTE